MKIYKIFFICFFSFFCFMAKAGVINNKISEKYLSVFSENILSNEDVKNYREIFELQNKCEWKKANKNIFKIKDKILIGHVLAQRYLHPQCYKSEFIELTYWLKKYNDHPQAKRIYRLAIRRMLKGYKSPNKPINPLESKKQI